MIWIVFDSRSSEASKKVLWAKRIAFAFYQIHKEISQKIAPERKRSSIEFERSEN